MVLVARLPAAGHDGDVSVRFLPPARSIHPRWRLPRRSVPHIRTHAHCCHTDNTCNIRQNIRIHFGMSQIVVELHLEFPRALRWMGFDDLLLDPKFLYLRILLLVLSLFCSGESSGPALQERAVPPADTQRKLRRRADGVVQLRQPLDQQTRVHHLPVRGHTVSLKLLAVNPVVRWLIAQNQFTGASTTQLPFT